MEMEPPHRHAPLAEDPGIFTLRSLRSKLQVETGTGFHVNVDTLLADFDAFAQQHSQSMIGKLPYVAEVTFQFCPTYFNSNTTTLL